MSEVLQSIQETQQNKAVSNLLNRLQAKDQSHSKPSSKQEINSINPFKEIMAVSLNVIKNTPITAAGITLPTDQVTGNVILRYSSPSTAMRSLVLYLDVEDNSTNELLTSFVLRKEEERARKTRKYAQTHAKASAVRGKYLPQEYIIDSKSAWTAVERVGGIEEEEIQTSFETEEFNRIYARETLIALLEITSANLFPADVTFVRGHNCKFNPITGDLKFVEPENLMINDKKSPYGEIIANQIFAELRGCTNYTGGYYKGMEENADRTNERKFMFEFMKLVAMLDGWENLSRPNSHSTLAFYNYICSVDPEFDSHSLIQKYDIEDEYESKYVFKESFSPDFIKAIKENDFSAFNRILRDYEKFITFDVIPKSKE